MKCICAASLLHIRMHLAAAYHSEQTMYFSVFFRLLSGSIVRSALLQGSVFQLVIRIDQKVVKCPLRVIGYYDT